MYQNLNEKMNSHISQQPAHSHRRDATRRGRCGESDNRRRRAVHAPPRPVRSGQHSGDRDNPR